MKTFIFVTCLSAFIAAPLFGEPEFALVTATKAQSNLKIERLQQEFDRRRAKALRPVAAWYREQLETLQKKLFTEAPGSEAKVAEVLKAAKEAFWQKDHGFAGVSFPPIFRPPLG